MRTEYKQAIRKLDILNKLQEFDPVVIGTPPLGIDIASSDIDVACSSDDLEKFVQVSTAEFECKENFRCRKTVLQHQSSVIVQFRALSWDFELFCQSIPTEQQWGVRHFKIEQRLLEVAPELRAIVICLKQNGLKTEPAFATALNLPGDPYEAILDFESLNDDDLKKLVVAKLQSP